MSAPRHLLAGHRVLVTGAGGFIGTALVQRLAAAGSIVTAIARRPGRLDPASSAYQFVPCDLRFLAQTRDVVQACKPQLVVHLAAQPDGAEDVKRMHAVIDHNIQAVGNLLDAILELPSVSLVYGDSAKVYGNGPVPHAGEQRLEPLSTYAVSKQAGWSLIDVYRRVHGLQAMALRPTLVYGPNQAFNLFTYLVNAIASGREEIVLDGGAQTRDPLYIDDVVDAFIAAAEHLPRVNGLTLPVGGNREISVAELASLTVRLLGGRQRVVACPVNVRPTEMLRSWCDNAEAHKLLGWEPRVSLENGIVRTARAILPQAFAGVADTHEKV